MPAARHTFDRIIFAVRNERSEVVANIDRRDEPEGHRIAAALSFVACMRTEDIEAAIEMGLCPMHNDKAGTCNVRDGEAPIVAKPDLLSADERSTVEILRRSEESSGGLLGQLLAVVDRLAPRVAG
jgi:hypothetical protein